jgi:hypothetical protein
VLIEVKEMLPWAILNRNKLGASAVQPLILKLEEGGGGTRCFIVVPFSFILLQVLPV